MKAFATFLIALIGIPCIMVGCAQKPKLPQQSAAAPPAVTQKAKKDSADIFNEFYNDSAVALDKAKNIKTFSLKTSKAKAKETASAPMENTPGSYTPGFSDNGRFVVQVATVGSRVLADELATEFKEKGYPSYVLEVQNPTPNLTGTYYRVRIGGFSTSVDAKAFAENILVPAHFEYWVDRKANESAAPLESQLDRSPSPSGTSTSAPQGSSAPVYTPPPATYESTIIPGPGTVPATPVQTSPSSSTGGWHDSSSKW